MHATRILWVQVLVVFSAVLAGIWSATQWTAAALGYQPELGPHWIMLGPWPIYPPYSFFWWWFSFDAYAPNIFDRGAYIAISGVGVAINRPTRRALEQLYAELLFQRSNAFAQRGLLDSKRTGRTRKTHRVCGGHSISQLPDLYGHKHFCLSCISHQVKYKIFILTFAYNTK